MRIHHRHALAGAICAIALPILGVAACSKSSSDDGTPQAVALPLKAGSVVCTNSKFATGGYSVSAGFYDATTAGSAGSCTVETTDGCTIQQCNISPAVDAGTPGGTIKEVSAGLISIRGGGTDIELSTGPSASYPAIDKGGLLWSGGESITIDAAGDPQGAPSFSANLTAPSFVDLQSPKVDPLGVITIDRANALTIGWSAPGVPAGNVAATLRSFASNTATVSAICQYPAADGTGIIPKSVLSKFPGGTGSLSVSGLSERIQVVDDWRITLSLVANGGSQGSDNAANVAFR